MEHHHPRRLTQIVVSRLLPIWGVCDMSKMTLTAPKRIWLQVADGGESEQPFPTDHEGITWCEDSCLDDEVEYVRADLAHLAERDAQRAAEQAVDVEHVEILREMLHDYEKREGFSLERAALSAGIRALSGEQAGWMPIETAPKDGLTILLGHHDALEQWRTMRGQWLSKSQVELLRWIRKEREDPNNGDEGWYETSVEATGVPSCWPTTPTRWMPLPRAPNKEGE